MDKQYVSMEYPHEKVQRQVDIKDYARESQIIWKICCLTQKKVRKLK